jgi:hypothetical protein
MNIEFSSQKFLDEAMRIVKEAEKEGMMLRILGSVAIRIHCPEFAELHKKMKRLGDDSIDFTDLDFMTNWESAKKLPEFLPKLGYNQLNVGISTALHGFGRQIYSGPNIRLDIFVDKLAMCHTIDFKNRLKVDFPTISLADLLLEKMQIVEINLKDIKDTIVLLREHNVGSNDKETINGKYIAKLLANDWGFYYTVTSNLSKIKDIFLKKIECLNEDDVCDVRAKIDHLLKIIEDEPKSLNWKIRSKIGTKIKWYTDVTSC